MDKNREVWKRIDGFWFYKISNRGRVKSVLNGIKIMKLNSNSDGYLVVNIRSHGKGVTKYVHRLVAEHFIKNAEKKPCVNHKNSVKTDNRVTNLEWCTNAENLQHASRNGKLGGFAIPKEMKRDVSGLPWEEKKAYWGQVFRYLEEKKLVRKNGKQ